MKSQSADLRFGRVWGASGVEGFFGQNNHGGPEYWFHNVPAFGPSFTGMTFVAKTTTLKERLGNMPLRPDYVPKEWLPRCIYVNHRKGIALNAVGLSGPGARVLLAERGDRRWQKRKDPFQISFMSVEGTPEARQAEWREFLELLSRHIRGFETAQLGIQENKSCPNVGLSHSGLDNFVDEIISDLDLASEILPDSRVRFIVKLAANFPPQKSKRVSEHPACAALCVSNTIPWRTNIPWLPAESPIQIDWDNLFGKGAESPLIRRGFEQPGGLSGKPLLPIVCEWLRQARAGGVECHLNGGGGILSPSDAWQVKKAGANSVSLGSIAFLRPMRVERTIYVLRERRVNVKK